jgi:hypothetical protein
LKWLSSRVLLSSFRITAGSREKEGEGGGEGSVVLRTKIEVVNMIVPIGDFIAILRSLPWNLFILTFAQFGQNRLAGI